ncbi:MAG: multidrug MFS transporter [Nitrospirales bacterium]|nr:MAG: multidrug MFS transporter [Nitrospirales bacterium]
MIFVTVGNALQGFPRLLEAVEREAKQGILSGEDILFQCGHTNGFFPETGRLVSFLPLEEFEGNIQQAELVIAHAGAGTLIHVFRAGKVPLVMPRQKRYGEHVDDHQLEFVEALAAQGRVLPVLDSDGLGSVIECARIRTKKTDPLIVESGLHLISDAIKEVIHCP